MERLRRNLPNALTLLRLGLGMTFFLFPHNIRLAVVAVAATTDALDGFLARKFEVQSEFGRILDPIADRLFVAVMALTFLFEMRMTLGQLVLVGLRDLVVVFGALLIVSVGRKSDFEHIETRIFGKAATFLQFAFLISVVLVGYALWPVVIITAVFSGMAGADYIWSYFRHARAVEQPA